VNKFRRRPSLILILAALLLILLPLLAWMQYEWIGKVSEGDRDRMQASLRRASSQFREDFDREIARVFATFRLEPVQEAAIVPNDYAALYTRWMETARYPRLIGELFIAERRNGEPHLERLDPVRRKFEPAEWPAWLITLKNGMAGGRPLFFRHMERPIDPNIPALFIPVIPPPFLHQQHLTPDFIERLEPIAYVVVTLSLDCIRKELLPELVRTSFPDEDFSIRIVDRDDPAKVIFAAGPATSSAGSGDISTNFFSLYPPGVAVASGPGIAIAPNAGLQTYWFHAERALSFTPQAATGVVFEEDGGAWQLVVTHRAGSVDAAIAQVRRRNLAISTGILLLLALSMAMIMISTNRAQRLAQQQIEFASAVSHELRTPLAVICSAGENLADGVVADPAQARQYGMVVRDEGRRLSQMIEQVLDFSGIQSERKTYKFRPTDIGEVIQCALDLCETQIREHGFGVEMDIAADMPVVQADKPALVRALQNLISNALKYGGTNRWIGIRAWSTPAEVCITVDDRGDGISSEDLPHIFEPFYRGRNVVDAQIQGSGLGLSLVQKIVEAHKGSVSVTSTSGQGSSFRIVLSQDERLRMQARREA
jgi:signal transduction histidine kinase